MPKEFNSAECFVDAELERSLLAAVQEKPSLFWRLFAEVPEEAFAQNASLYRELHHAILEGSELPTVEAVPAKDLENSAKKLLELYQLRLLDEFKSSLARTIRAKREGEDLGSALDILRHASEELTNIQQAVSQKKGFYNIAEKLPGVMEQAFIAQKVREEGSCLGIPIPDLEGLNKSLGGFQPGLHILTAVPGAGKTTLALQLALASSRMGFPVVYVSFEYPERLPLKLLCMAGRLVEKDYREGKGDLHRLEQMIGEYKPLVKGIHILEGHPETTILDVKTKALFVKAKTQAKHSLIVVDYLQNWARFRKENRDFRHLVSGLASELLGLAKELKSPVLAISSMNRAGYDKGGMSALKESGDLEYDADSIMSLQEDKELTESLQQMSVSIKRGINLRILKNRFGDENSLYLCFSPETGHFAEIEGRRD